MQNFAGIEELKFAGVEVLRLAGVEVLSFAGNAGVGQSVMFLGAGVLNASTDGLADAEEIGHHAVALARKQLPCGFGCVGSSNAESHPA